MARLPWVFLSLLLGLWVVELAWAGVAKRATLPPVTDSRWTTQYDHQFRKYSKRYFGPQFDWRWFKAQAIIESKLNSSAVGSGGPRGLMQIKPATLKSLQRLEPRLREKLSGAEANIAAGIYYNRYLYDLWTPAIPVRDRLLFAFASYNAGHAKIIRAYKGVKSTAWRPVSARAPAHTRNYIQRIQSIMPPGSAIDATLVGTVEDA